MQAICFQRRLTVIEGVAGAGKTTAIDAAREAHELAGWQVVGCATSGQAARTLASGAHLQARTVASMLWHLDHHTLELTPKTLVVLDEAGMTSDPDLQRLLEAVERAGSKVVLVGDPRQLGAVGPGGALDAVLARHPNAVVRLTDNVRQTDVAEQITLEYVRDGDAALAVRWYAHTGRIRTAPTRLDTLLDTVDGWATDIAEGLDSVMLAWRRRDVADLNRLARNHRQQAGELTGPELQLPDGRAFAAGDTVVLTESAHDVGLVTSQRATVADVDLLSRLVMLRTDDDRLVPFDPARGLEHGYATTIHRAQGATVDTTHLLAGGGGRELAYVGLSRARTRTTVHATSETLEATIEQLGEDWRHCRQPRWVHELDGIDMPTPARIEVSARLDALQRRRPAPDRELGLGL